MRDKDLIVKIAHRLLRPNPIRVQERENEFAFQHSWSCTASKRFSAKRAGCNKIYEKFKISKKFKINQNKDSETKEQKSPQKAAKTKESSRKGQNHQLFARKERKLCFSNIRKHEALPSKVPACESRTHVSGRPAAAKPLRPKAATKARRPDQGCKQPRSLRQQSDGVVSRR